MAKQRYIDTRFWHDNFIRESLNPLDRYLFLYFLTNDKTNIAGVYELPISMIASETGIEKEMIKKMLPRLKGKVDYYDGWVVIRNFQKYQAMNNIKIKQGIENEMSMIPDKIRTKIGYQYPIDEQSHLNLNSNLNSNSNTNTTASGEGKEIGEIIFLFKAVNPMIQKLYGMPPQRKAVTRLLKEFGREKLEVMINALPQINGQQFWPKSTTPVQLENNIGIYMAKKSEFETIQKSAKIKVAIIQ